MSRRKESTAPLSKGSPSSASTPKTPKPTSATTTPSVEDLLQQITKLDKPSVIQNYAVNLRDSLLKEWKKGTERNLDKIEVTLEAAKVLLTKLQFLPVTQGQGENVQSMIIARDILEVGALFSILKCEKNTCNPTGIKDFERYFSQLKQYYFDLGKLIKKESESMYEILGMNLLNLLSQYKIADFHRELELFIHQDTDRVLQNPYIKKAVEIEQFIMEGQYNKIYALKGANQEDLKKAGLTSVGFKYFVDHLENTLKDHTTEIADVIGSAYDHLTIQSAMQLLNLSDSNKMGQIIKAQNWSIEEGVIYFHAKKDSYDAVPAEELIQNSLMYAEELDTII